ncbi:hypothetical protein [Thermodesulfovibrio sp. TK110]
MSLRLSEKEKKRRAAIATEKFEKDEIKKKKYSCIYCGTKTYNSKKICALCEKGITAIYNAIKKEGSK